MKRPLTLLEWKMLQWLAKPYGSGTDDSSYPTFSLEDGEPRYFSNEGRDFTTEACRTVLTFMERGWTKQHPEYQYYRLNEAGRQAARELPRPDWKPPSPPALTDRDFQVLNELESVNRPRYSSHPRAWASPLDCGGSNGSHHSASLTKLVRHSLVELRGSGGRPNVIGDAIVPEPRLSKRAKGSRAFRITDAGVEALVEWRKTRER
jgi:hypothetical protein